MGQVLEKFEKYWYDWQFTAKIIAFFGVELLHSRLTDFHQVKFKRVTVTTKYSNLSSVAHDICSREVLKGGKFEDNSCIDISFLQLPSIYRSIRECDKFKFIPTSWPYDLTKYWSHLGWYKDFGKFLFTVCQLKLKWK